ncbi:hypothetical protein PENANT_c003G09931 [Penicillium antarcticum]|uniref:C2H2-type domain-containing protein n=1 Tax=Penicillium antarcticum TaxID=416450 RepID=A0A1V6QIP2_9EURO|nr:hypothetical protein PENANT_c003G09931 [Penicillium antarcticum]
MHSCSPIPNFSHTVPLSDESQTFQTFDSSFPVDDAFVTRASQLPFSSSLEQEKDREGSYFPQSWWKPEDCQYSAESLSAEPLSDDRLSPWNRALSAISDPQSSHSINSGSLSSMAYYASLSYQQEDALIPQFDAQVSTYPMPNSFVDMIPSLPLSKPPICGVQPDRSSPLNSNEIIWSSSHSDRTPTPEALLQAPTHVNPCIKRRERATSKSRSRKSTGKVAASTPGRRRRRAATSSPDDGTPRTFTCSFAPYGCKSTFTSKNEWKRHVTSKHLLLGFFRCDVGRCNILAQKTPFHAPRSTSTTPQPGQPNDFNRKDLFTQHQRRMHAPWLQTGHRRAPTDVEKGAFESSLEQVRKRCWHGLRHPPTKSHCGFCGEVFSGTSSWDTRMEHVGRHFEREDPASLGEGVEDVALREWGLREGILTLLDGQVCLASLVENEG